MKWESFSNLIEVVENAVGFTTETIVIFLCLMENYHACRPAACQKFQQSELVYLEIYTLFAMILEVCLKSLNKQKLSKHFVELPKLLLTHFWGHQVFCLKTSLNIQIYRLVLNDSVKTTDTYNDALVSVNNHFSYPLFRQTPASL